MTGKRNKIQKNNFSSAQKISVSEYKRKDEAVTTIIRGLNFLISYAAKEQLGVATITLNRAKEEIAYWASQFSFDETNEDKYIHNTLHVQSVASLDFIAHYASIKDAEKKKTFLLNLDHLSKEYLAILGASST